MSLEAPTPFISYYLRRYVGPTDTLADLGCGPDRYRAVVAPARYIGLDITADPTQSGKPRMVDIVASAMQIPLADSSVDAVTSISAFCIFPDIDGALAEILRILKPGGRVLLFDYNRRTQHRLGRFENRTYPAWTQRQFRDRLLRAGFADAEILVPRVTRQVGKIERAARIVAEELFGTWAVVCARKV